MISETKSLLRVARMTDDPQGFVTRWLVQDFTVHNAAIAILALHNLTGQLYRHPETPCPTPMQEMTCPWVWSTAMQKVLGLPQLLAQFAVKDSLSTGHDVTQEIISRIKHETLEFNRISISESDLPDSRISGADKAFSKANGVVDSAENFKKYRSQHGAGRYVGPRFIPPKKRV